MNSSRTHPNSTIAFPLTADYACALTVHLSTRARFVRWLRNLIN